MRGACADAHSVATGDFDDGSQLGQLYAAAASACLAAFHGQPNMWQQAQSRLSGVQRGTVSCWEQEIYDISAQLIQVHNSAPEAQFKISSEGGLSSCPRLTGIDPSHGPAGGGYQAMVLGENLPASLRLYFGGSEVDAIRQADGTAIVDVPAGHTGTVTVTISDVPGRGVTPDLQFTYDQDHQSTIPDPTPQAPPPAPVPTP
jgi:hypothetical protein